MHSSAAISGTYHIQLPRRGRVSVSFQVTHGQPLHEHAKIVSFYSQFLIRTHSQRTAEAMALALQHLPKALEVGSDYGRPGESTLTLLW
jgi:hypothetical protein